MATSISTFNTLQQKQQLLSVTLRKYPSSNYLLSNIFTTSPYTLKPTSCNKNNAADQLTTSIPQHKLNTKTLDSASQRELKYGFSSLGSKEERVGRKSRISSVVGDKSGKKFRKDVDFRRKRDFSSLRGVDERVGVKSKEVEVGEKKELPSDGTVGEGERKERRKRTRKAKVETPELLLRVGLDMCSKKGDFLSAISLYDIAKRDGVSLEQYHYTVLLYLCSSAAVGVVRPAKSGSGNRSSEDLIPNVNSIDLSEIRDASKEDFGVGLNSAALSKSSLVDYSESHGWRSNKMEGSSFIESGSEDPKYNPSENKIGSPENNLYEKNAETSRLILNGSSSHDKDSCVETEGSSNQENRTIQITEDVKKYALVRGFEIYERMCAEEIPLNEATLTSVARMAMSMGDGHMALEMVNKMKEMGINRRLRSYGPALFTFCDNGDIEQAFMVEEHMLENGVYPEEPELEALLKLSVEAGRGDKVYYVLHELRKSVRKVSPSTADVIEAWFRSTPASRVGKRKWDQKLIMEGIESGGGGWHGQGWLGRGRWITARTLVGTDGVCESCGDKLVTIDLDPKETEDFAESVATIASKRERDLSFQNFQKWLDYYGPFEAVVDAANVGLFNSRQFSPSKVNAIVNGIRQKLPSKKWPLIVLHNRRITGGKMDESPNKNLVDKWKNADAIYATPTGSNDDWYWLYAAIKFKCLLVTNDEMRDHIFQLLGNDFFPRWKERHQVRFSFSDGGPEFNMPPPCSVVIQESEKGHWHIPIVLGDGIERERVWLCVTRTNPKRVVESPVRQKEEKSWNQKITRTSAEKKLQDHDSGRETQGKAQEHKGFHSNLKNILSESLFRNNRTLVLDIEEAEKLGRCIIDFQI